MNEHYSIAEENQEVVDKFQLRNLGKQTHIATIGTSKRGYYGEKTYSSQSFYAPTTAKDYDEHFAHCLIEIEPPYKIPEFVDYHLNYYLSNQGEKDNFIKHIKYVVLPIIQKRKGKEVYVELLNDWIEQHITSNKLKKGTMHITVTGNGNSIVFDNTKSNISINTNNASDMENLKTCISQLNKIIENFSSLLSAKDYEILKEDLEYANKQLEKKEIETSKLAPVLSTIFGILKSVPSDTIANIISNPIYEFIKTIITNQ